MTKRIELINDEQIILLDALACLIDACHWADANDTTKAKKTMELYQRLGGELIDDEDSTDEN
jgi:hypothetical protein